MKNSTEGSIADLSWQKKEVVNLKLGQSRFIEARKWRVKKLFQSGRKTER